ncbi:MAG: efflux transporter outer membrane subunit [Gammaproteobacteria bacterium]
MKLRFYAVVLSLLPLGCAVGPDYVKPEVATPKMWSEAKPAGTASPDAYSAWWMFFNDPMLDKLITEAVNANLDLQLAAARLREARTQRIIAVAGGLPTIGARSNVNRRLNASSFSQGGGSGTTATGGGFGFGEQIFNIYQMGFDAQWEIDLFGGIRRAVEAADATIAAEEENSRDVLISLLAEVARNYIDVRTNQQLLAVAEKHLRTQQETLALTESRQKAGLTSELEVAQAASQLAFTKGQLPVYDTAKKQAVHALSILLGREPGALLSRLEKTGPIPAAENPALADLPSELLRRRPDIRRAERQLAASSAQIGVATAELYPKLNLAAFIGLQSLSITDFTPLGKSWSMASTLTMPLFNWGKLQANIEAKKAFYEQSFLTYRKTILDAFKEVEDALISYHNEQERLSALTEDVEANRLAVELANERYLKGLTGFLDVLIAERGLYQAQTNFVESEAQLSVQLVALYKALGGGWENRPVPENQRPLKDTSLRPGG